MEILGIGPSEFILILLIAIIVLGPKDMQKAGRTIGRWLNQLINSEGWRVFQRTSSELRNLPRNLMKEANMEELQKTQEELRRSIDPRPDPSKPSPSTASKPSKASPSASVELNGNPPTSTQPGDFTRMPAPNADAATEASLGENLAQGSKSDTGDDAENATAPGRGADKND